MPCRTVFLVWANTVFTLPYRLERHIHHPPFALIRLSATR
jgi:hypothetical protein